MTSFLERFDRPGVAQAYILQQLDFKYVDNLCVNDIVRNNVHNCLLGPIKNTKQAFKTLIDSINSPDEFLLDEELADFFSNLSKIVAHKTKDSLRTFLRSSEFVAGKDYISINYDTYHSYGDASKTFLSNHLVLSFNGLKNVLGSLDKISSSLFADMQRKLLDFEKIHKSVVENYAKNRKNYLDAIAKAKSL